MLFRFEKWYIKKYYKAVIKRYFFISELYTLTKIYQEWYKYKGSVDWEEFYKWLDKNVVLKQLILERHIGYIKRALIITFKDLEERAKNWKSN